MSLCSQGEPDVVPVKKSKAGDVEVLYFIFQRQRFEVDENEQVVIMVASWFFSHRPCQWF